jgi:hypothetical protein
MQQQLVAVRLDYAVGESELVAVRRTRPARAGRRDDADIVGG